MYSPMNTNEIATAFSKIHLYVVFLISRYISSLEKCEIRLYFSRILEKLKTYCQHLIIIIFVNFHNDFCKLIYHNNFHKLKFLGKYCNFSFLIEIISREIQGNEFPRCNTSLYVHTTFPTTDDSKRRSSNDRS